MKIIILFTLFFFSCAAHSQPSYNHVAKLEFAVDRNGVHKEFVVFYDVSRTPEESQFLIDTLRNYPEIQWAQWYLNNFSSDTITFRNDSTAIIEFFPALDASLDSQWVTIAVFEITDTWYSPTSVAIDSINAIVLKDKVEIRNFLVERKQWWEFW